MFGLEKALADGSPAFPCLKGFPGEEARRVFPVGPSGRTRARWGEALQRKTQTRNKEKSPHESSRVAAAWKSRASTTGGFQASHLFGNGLRIFAGQGAGPQDLPTPGSYVFRSPEVFNLAKV